MQASATTSAPHAMSTQSHKTRLHNRNKKGSDPFLALADDAAQLPDLSIGHDEHENRDSHSESLLADLVLTPLNMVALILSLFVVDRQQRQWRLSQHPSGSVSLWSRLTNWSWQGPEPYQDSRNGTWKKEDGAASQTPTAAGFQGWYTKKKHRAMAKMELNDAFEMRRRVVFALVAWAFVGLFAITYGARHMYRWLSKG